MIKKKLIIIICFLILLNSICPVVGETFETEALEIKCEPTTLTLSPGEAAIVHIKITNIHNEVENISVMYIPTECCGFTPGELSEEYFQLDAGQSKDIELHLTASSLWFHSDEYDDSIVRVSWGTNLSLYNNRYPDSQTVDGEYDIEIEIIKDRTIPYIIIAVIAIIMILVVVLIILYLRKRKKSVRPTRPEQGEWPSGGAEGMEEAPP